MNITLLILALALSFIPDKDATFTCTVVDEKSVSCQIGKEATIWQLSALSEDRLDEWRLVAQQQTSPEGGVMIHWNAPLLKEPLKVGQQVKAQLSTDGELIPVASCDVRRHRRVNVYARQGERAPAAAYGLPDDCQVKANP